MTKMLLFGTGTLDGELTLNLDEDKVLCEAISYADELQLCAY